MDDGALIERALLGAELLIVGDAKGGDKLALEIALAWDIIPAVYCADAKRFEQLQAQGIQCFLSTVTWQMDRVRAGPVRNAMMVRRAFEERAAGMDVCCSAFPGPKSVGTYDCMTQLKAAGFDVTVEPLKAA